MTNFSSSHEIEQLKNAFRANSLATPLRDAVSVSMQQDVETGLRRLISNDFDQAPVKDRSKTIGWVQAEALRKVKSIDSAMVRLADAKFVAAGTTLSRVFESLHSDRLVFTVNDDGLHGFICVSDLDRHVVRAYFAMLTSQIEMMLAHIISSFIDSSQIESVLTHSPTHQDGRSMSSQFADAKRRGVQTHPVEYLYLGQLIELLPSAHLPGGRQPSRRVMQDLRRVNDKRNFVAHSARRGLTLNWPSELFKLDLAFGRLLSDLPKLIQAIRST